MTMEVNFASPMLAAKPDAEKKTSKGLVNEYDLITYPKLASPKYDGIRAVVRGGKLWSRNGKLIPNVSLQKRFGRKAYEGFDGELVAGHATADFNYCQSVIMSGAHEDEDTVKFYVFDFLRGNVAGYAYAARMKELAKAVIGGTNSNDAYIVVVEGQEVRSQAEANIREAELLMLGFEGMMLRDPSGAHKAGRSTMREQGLIAIKRFVQAEGRITGYTEQETNTNEATVDELGRTKRSSAKAGKVKNGKLGNVKVEIIACSEAPEMVGTENEVGTGFNDDQRTIFWQQRKGLIGQIITFKFQAHGSKDAARIPVFIGFRPDGA
jgi:DNA ligase 1